jgi:hypothetical protein
MSTSLIPINLLFRLIGRKASGEESTREAYYRIAASGKTHSLKSLKRLPFQSENTSYSRLLF